MTFDKGDQVNLARERRPRAKSHSQNVTPTGTSSKQTFMFLFLTDHADFDDDPRLNRPNAATNSKNVLPPHVLDQSALTITSK